MLDPAAALDPSNDPAAPPLEPAPPEDEAVATPDPLAVDAILQQAGVQDVPGLMAALNAGGFEVVPVGGAPAPAALEPPMEGPPELPSSGKGIAELAARLAPEYKTDVP